uniref:Uncharacterized protein n=1 Tax=Anguilla anguilla TaxID=7936 RepID=A0A0E9U747_ANGAN
MTFPRLYSSRPCSSPINVKIKQSHKLRMNISFYFVTFHSH